MADNDNALGSLFTRLANSVRGGLGDIGTMKPIVFPDRVDEIVALLEHYKNNGGDSGDSSVPTKVETGSFTASETGVGRVYINHTLGEIPDFVMIRLSSREGTLNTDKNPIMAAWSFKDNIYPSTIKGGLNCINGNRPAYTGHDVAIDDSYMAQVFSYVRCLNKVTFYVGSDLSFENNANDHFVPNATYTWLAVSGLKNVAVESLIATENGTYAPSEGVYGFNPVVVNVPVSEPVLEALEITENGTYTAPEGVDGYNPVTVNVPDPEINLQDKTITENGEYTADEGFDGLGKVLVEIAGSGGGASGIERITIIPEQTVTTAYDSAYGCYKTILTPNERITEDSVLAICFNDEWYACSAHKYAFTAGAWNTTMSLFGNHKIMTKYYNGTSLTWKETAEQNQPFLFTQNGWICTSSADSFTIRVDKLIVTE